MNYQYNIASGQLGNGPGISSYSSSNTTNTTTNNNTINSNNNNNSMGRGISNTTNTNHNNNHNNTNHNHNNHNNHNNTTSNLNGAANGSMSMIPQPTLLAPNTILTIGPYKHRKDLTRESVVAKYQILGYIAAGTYGKVYKAKAKKPPPEEEDGAHQAQGSQQHANTTQMLLNAGNSAHSHHNMHSYQLSNQALYKSYSKSFASNNSTSTSANGSSRPHSGFSRPSNDGGAVGGSLRDEKRDDNGHASGNASSSAHGSGHNTGTATALLPPNNDKTLHQAAGDSGGGKAAVSSAVSGVGNAPSSSEPELLYAIKKFKNDNHLSNKNYNHDINGNEIIHYTGISQSAMREMSICREISNKNITKTIDILLENKSIYIVLEFCEHDLLQIIHYHSHPEVRSIPERTVKSLIWQILNGVLFLHKNWIFHRDLKPANIMVTSSGVVKIGDLGLARKFNNPLQSLYTGDKVVVTIWYRAPELLLGTRNYTPAIDLWAVGCILAELLSLRPIFKGEEAKMDLNNKKLVPFQTNQFKKIIEIIGSPTAEVWPSLPKYPEYSSFIEQLPTHYNSSLASWYKAVGGTNKNCLALLKGLLEYDPIERLTAENALVHSFFLEQPILSENAFDGLTFKYPKRRIHTDDNDIISGVLASKRHLYEDSKGRKRQR